MINERDKTDDKLKQSNSVLPGNGAGKKGNAAKLIELDAASEPGTKIPTPYPGSVPTPTPVPLLVGNNRGRGFGTCCKKRQYKTRRDIKRVDDIRMSDS